MPSWIDETKRRLRRHLPERLIQDVKSLSRSFAPIGRLPGFVIIGAQKGGTSALFEMLSRHPDVTPSIIKEVHYFDLNYFRGEQWYRRHFPETSSLISGEASPYYLFHPAVPGRLKSTIPQAKLIVILRDPVERALSHYFHALRRGQEILPLLEALQAEEQRLDGAEEDLDRPDGTSFAHRHFSYVARSRYLEQLARWRAVFDDSQILMLSNRDLRRAPDQTFARTCAFLGVPTIPAPGLAREIGGEKPEVPQAARDFLNARLGDIAAAVKKEYGLVL